jgi:predicted regulator of amino acid metabolism with ACT domain
MINNFSIEKVESYDSDEKEYFPAFEITLMTDERLVEVVIDQFSSDEELRMVFQNMADRFLDS